MNDSNATTSSANQWVAQIKAVTDEVFSSDNIAFYMTVTLVIILQFFIDQGASLVSTYRKLVNIILIALRFLQILASRSQSELSALSS